MDYKSTSARLDRLEDRALALTMEAQFLGVHGKYNAGKQYGFLWLPGYREDHDFAVMLARRAIAYHDKLTGR